MKKNNSGFTLIELIVVMAIFSIMMAGLFLSFRLLASQSTRHFHLAETSINVAIASNIIERDLAMVGYGMAEDYTQVPAFTIAPHPRKAVGTVGGALILRGLAGAVATPAAQRWSYIQQVNMGGNIATYATWSGAPFNATEENLVLNDRVLMVEPSSRELIVDTGTANRNHRFIYPGASGSLISRPANHTYSFIAEQQAGTMLYGFYSDSGLDATTTDPYYTISYSLGGILPAECAATTTNLIRAEGIDGNGGTPLLSCVRDFAFAFGLDDNEDGVIDRWDTGGSYIEANYVGSTAPKVLNRRLKQIRVYILVQDGIRDPEYTFSNPDTSVAANQVRVGELNLPGGATGHIVTLTPAELHYRWKMLSIAVTTRNIR